MGEATEQRDIVTQVTAGACSVRILPRAEIWTMFAAAAMGVGDPAENTTLAAKAADRMLLEFDKRFPLAEASAP